jgi:gluconokinase
VTVPSGSGRPESTGDPQSTTLVVMGVSGSGKSTVGRAVADTLGWTFAEGDDLHPPANVAAMASGHPLGDEERWPWLRAVAASIGEAESTGENLVVTCSALKRSYRDLLVDGHPSVRFCLIDVSPEELRRRLAERRGHYMPASLLHSQLDTLEPLGLDEPGFVVTADTGPAAVLAAVLDALTSPEPGRGVRSRPRP